MPRVKMTKVNNFDLDILLFCAFRYALGRMTYIVSTAVELICKYIDALHPHTKLLMIKEITTAIAKGEAGWDCDVQEWKVLLTALGESNEKDN